MIEVESGALDHTRVWEAARALLDYLDQSPARDGRVLELGSGTGWLGLHLAQRWPGAEVGGAPRGRERDVLRRSG